MLGTKITSILVIGGCGYVGRHVVRYMASHGVRVHVLDDLSNAIPLADTDPNIVQHVTPAAIAEYIKDPPRVDIVYHLAAKKSVPESMEHPVMYYRSNIESAAMACDIARACGARLLVYASSAAVYSPSDTSLSVGAETNPATPYGRTKLVGEWMMQDFSSAHGIPTLVLRYFNPIGGDDASPSVGGNLFPILKARIASAALAGTIPSITIYGDDYDTPDGSCVRDFVRIEDIVAAHCVDPAEFATATTTVRNVSSGVATSVKQLVAMAEAASGTTVARVCVSRRLGDVARIVGDGPGLGVFVSKTDMQF